MFLFAFATLQAAAQEVKISNNLQRAMNKVDTNTIFSHIAYLADDKLKGRLPGTEGYQMAVDYVIDQYKKMGVAPGGDNGGYTQQLVLRKSLLNNKSCVAVLKDKQGNMDSLQFATDYTAAPHPLLTNAAAEAALVFVGYGVEIPGQYTDYAGIDVTGKIVVLVAGAPDGLMSTLTAHFSNTGNKLNTAFAKGALGAVLINLANSPSGNAAAVIQSNVALNPTKTAAFGRSFIGNLKMVLSGGKPLLSRLFMHAGKNMEQALADIKKGKSASFALPYSLAASYKTTHTDFESYNVVGLIKGTDKMLKDEYALCTFRSCRYWPGCKRRFNLQWCTRQCFWRCVAAGDCPYL